MKLALIVVLAILAVAVLAGGIWLWTPDKSRAALEAKHLAARGDIIAVAGVSLHVRDTGPRAAPVVIMLHGFGSSLHTWESWAELLRPAHRVIRFDLPGAGLSSADPTGDYSDARTIELLVALMDRLEAA